MPLDGICVVDASTILAGPLCCQILGDFGAEVIKIEHPARGDSMRGHGEQKSGIPLWWKEINRNKRNLGLNLGHPRGAEVFLDLAKNADVIVENFRPGTLERWGIGPDKLKSVNPDLILLRLTAFGQKGPYSNRPGFGTLAEAMSGFAYVTGEPDGPPTLPAFGLADSICGIAASSAVLMALRHREVNGGGGQIIDLSILEPIMTAVGPGPTVYEQTGIVQERHGNRSTNNAPRNTYKTKDGHWVAVSSSAQSVAERIMTLVGHAELLDEEWFGTGRGRADHADLIDGYVSKWIADRDRNTVLAEFERVDAAIAPVFSSRDIVEDRHIRETEMLVRVEDADLGSLLMHNVMWKMSESPGEIRFTGRGLGANTDEILIEDLDYPKSVVESLRAEGVVA
ncbi:MAG: CoA transferase [Cryobacterium sp.]|nr:CoA transferase [Cryobacterium sp.]